MALPKRRTSKHRKRIRRSHLRIAKPALANCSRCGATKKPHTVCDGCGYYDGTEVTPKPPEI
jgi:large subunit ribosomal protein L32